MDKESQNNTFDEDILSVFGGKEIDADILAAAEAAVGIAPEYDAEENAPEVSEEDSTPESAEETGAAAAAMTAASIGTIIFEDAGEAEMPEIEAEAEPEIPEIEAEPEMPEAEAEDVSESAEADAPEDIAEEVPQEPEEPSVASEAVLAAAAATATMMVAAAEKELGTGLNGEAVIDREEWEKIIAQVDAEQAEKEAAEAAAAAALAAESADSAAAAAEGGEAVATRSAKKNKKKDKNGNGGKKKRHFWRNFLITILILGFLCCGAVGVLVYRIIKDTPKINPDNLYDLLSENSVLLDSQGNKLDNIYAGGSLRTNVEYKDLPQNLIDAIVCTEDKTFFKHHGFNIVRIVGAIWDSAKTGFKSKIEGTSTITQQLARNLYLPDTKSDRGWDGIIRKIKEAYYTLILEKELSKEQILEAYLNTVFLGYNADGVQAAAQAYFGKDVQDLTLVECACLATLPQLPNKYSPLKRLSIDEIDNPDEYDIIVKSNNWVICYNDAGEERIDLILRNMLDQEKISQEEYDSVKIHEDIRAALHPTDTIESSSEFSTYFRDYIVAQVMNDLQKKNGLSYEEAYRMVYKGGLIINSTLDPEIQKIVEDVYADHSNFANIGKSGINFDKKKNILYQDSSSRILLYLKDNLFNKDGEFILTKDEYEKMPDGGLKILAGKRLNIYKTTVGETVDYSLEFKFFYEWKDSVLYTTNGGYILIPATYKDRDADGNLIIKADYFNATLENGEKKYGNSFVFNEDGTVIVNPALYSLADSVIQPQSAYVIMENETGKVVAMIGGRDITGSKLFNRATNPRQTGSSIKPLSVYSTTLQKGFTNAKLNAENADGISNRPVYTAATPIDDIPTDNGLEFWPSNVTNKYGGATYLRYACQQSLNTCAVALFNNVLTPDEIVNNLENLGISTIVKSGDSNDINPAALALGGLTTGVSPLEMCAAYATFGNYGVYNTPTCYTTVTTKNGDVVLSAVTESRQVLDTEVASLMLNVLKSVVDSGGATAAKMDCQPVAGKTGTTSNNYDLWFCGLTPKYSATVWLGSDSNLYLSGTSSRSAIKVWKAVMEKVGKLDPAGKFELKGEAGFVTKTVDKQTGLLPTSKTPSSEKRSEIFIKGTEPKYADSDSRITLQVCGTTGYLATPWCTNVVSKNCVKRIGGVSWESLLATWKLKRYSASKKASLLTAVPDAVDDPPEYYCPLHNNDTKKYPVSPFAKYKEYKEEPVTPPTPTPTPTPTPGPVAETNILEDIWAWVLDLAG